MIGLIWCIVLTFRGHELIGSAFLQSDFSSSPGWDMVSAMKTRRPIPSHDVVDGQRYSYVQSSIDIEPPVRGVALPSFVVEQIQSIVVRVCDFVHRSDAYIPVSDAVGNVLSMCTFFLHDVCVTHTHKRRFGWTGTYTPPIQC